MHICYLHIFCFHIFPPPQLHRHIDLLGNGKMRETQGWRGRRVYKNIHCYAKINEGRNSAINMVSPCAILMRFAHQSFVLIYWVTMYLKLCSWLTMNTYIYIYIYIHTYIHTYTHTSTYTYIYTYIIHTYTNYTDTYIYIYIHAYIHTYVLKYIYTYIYT